MVKSDTGIDIGGPLRKFITLDGDPCQAAHDDAIRRLVRSNASRAARRGEPDFLSSSAQPSAVSVPTSESGIVPGTSRFALSSRKPMKRVRRRGPSKARGTPKDECLDAQALLRGPVSRAHDCLSVPLTFVNSQGTLLDSPGNMLIQQSYSTSWLATKTRSNVETMIEHLFSQVIEVQHLHPESTFCDLQLFSRRDEAIFHASLSIASVYYDTGASDLFHCQQTLHLVSRRLSDYALQTSDETIGAVALIVIHNLLAGTSEHSNLHMNGLQQMVQARGGLDRLPPRLRKSLSMIDIFHATTWNCAPRFPFIKPLQNLSLSLSALSSLSQTDILALQSFEQSTLRPSMHAVLHILRILTAVRYSDPLAVFNRLALSEAIYILEYQLLSDLDTGFHEVFRLAVFLYIDRVLREMPPLNTQYLARRLVDSLKSTQNTHITHSHTDLNIMLWILFIGHVTTGATVSRQYFLTELVRVCAALDVRQQAHFEKCLDNIGPALQPFNKQISLVWADIAHQIPYNS